ncbi:Crp/Fnr family transcriptional regulator [Sphingopyxis terrae]|uniref:cAMP-binding domain of CRP or a regulatory subunit of cAMP-dependent protein kinases n=1 Tax=Sphingopyxis terrae subsp. ummariensis TaxID=429001 RepID=A0A1Y6FTR6_9SPHN|nr:Crp/Fnr family transcriptional regulator [Sphingopyxis terrae]PCF91360.1 Crp/Fnr family transcriptional regulator [Sphingopyxis terrae subsp. ummariensis]SMQ76540.1 cAMP-binding domain of CRP or a regulatory subunit of cAMP-dependent protein kinases [Sphingopyxis terrae subsp. ummariensis]
MREPIAQVRSSALDLFVRKLLSHSRLSRSDQEAIRALRWSRRRLCANEYILREGDRAKACPILLNGFAYRQKMSADGGRQIVSLKIPGDALDFQSLYLRTADHNIQALTPVDLAVFPLREFEQILGPRPDIVRAVLVDILIEASICREWLLNIGRRNALSRLAHLLCEIHYRVRQIGSDAMAAKELPLTQEQLADLLGLTPVHINRTVRALEQQGAVQRIARKIVIVDLLTLRRIAQFSDLYLHRTNLAADKATLDKVGAISR